MTRSHEIRVYNFLYALQFDGHLGNKVQNNTINITPNLAAPELFCGKTSCRFFNRGLLDTITADALVNSRDKWWFTPFSLQWRHIERHGASNYQSHDGLLNRLFRRISKKTPKLRDTEHCEGNSPVTGEFPAQKASGAKSVSIWWHHHVPNATNSPYTDLTPAVLGPCKKAWE